MFFSILGAKIEKNTKFSIWGRILNFEENVTKNLQFFVFVFEKKMYFFRHFRAKMKKNKKK